MLDQEQQAILEICILASLADAANDDREREALKRVAASFSGGGEGDLSAAYGDLLVGRRTLEEIAARVQAPDLRQRAWEMAAVVCNADGALVQAEQSFLDRLRTALGLDPSATGAFSSQAEALATTPLGTTVVGPPPMPAGTGGAAQPPPLPHAAVDEAALDEVIERHAMLAGALELLPQSLATMAIVPVQMKLVYTVGKAYGVELDQGHVKEFLATAGAGLASQYVEGFGRKILGGIIRAVGGRMLGGAGQAAVGAAITFGATWAMGQVAKRYYAGGRRLDEGAIREAFQSLVAEGRALGERYIPEMQRRASGINPAGLVELIRQV